jgi:tetratricopeptide (TPR) repeat protein
VLTTAAQVATEGIELGADDPSTGANLLGYSPYYFLLSMRGALRSLKGDFAGAAADLEAGLRAPDLTLAICRVFVAEHGQFTGDAARSLAQARLAVGEIEETSAITTAVVFTQRGLGIAHTLNENWDEAVAAFDRSLNRAHESNTFIQAEPSTLAWKARAQVGLGKTDHARETLERAVRLGVEQGSRLHGPQACHVRAMIERAAGAPPEAIEASLAEALAAALEIAPGYEPLVHLEAATWAAERGDDAARRRALERARDLFATMGLPARAEAIGKQLG